MEPGASVILILITWVLATGITYGVMKTRQEGHDHRINALEQAEGKAPEFYVLRTEYESRHRDIQNQLQRIESKLDNQWGRRNLQ